MDNIKFTKDAIRDWIAMGGSKTWFEFKANKRKKMPARKVIVTNSPWDKPNNRNYCVSGYIGDKLIWCENGVSLDSAVCTVWCAARGE